MPSLTAIYCCLKIERILEFSFLTVLDDKMCFFLFFSLDGLGSKSQRSRLVSYIPCREINLALNSKMGLKILSVSNCTTTKGQKHHYRQRRWTYWTSWLWKQHAEFVHALLTSPQPQNQTPNRPIITQGLFTEAIEKKHCWLMSITVSLYPRYCLAKLHNINNV